MNLLPLFHFKLPQSNWNKITITSIWTSSYKAVNVVALSEEKFSAGIEGYSNYIEVKQGNETSGPAGPLVLVEGDCTVGCCRRERYQQGHSKTVRGSLAGGRVDGASTPADGRSRQPLRDRGVEGAALREPNHLSHPGPPRVPVLLPHARRPASCGPSLPGQWRRGSCRLCTNRALVKSLVQKLSEPLLNVAPTS